MHSAALCSFDVETQSPALTSPLAICSSHLCCVLSCHLDGVSSNSVCHLLNFNILPSSLQILFWLCSGKTLQIAHGDDSFPSAGVIQEDGSVSTYAS